MKVAFVNQPIDDIDLPPVRAGSITIWIYHVARRLAKHCDVIVYGKKDGFQNKIEYDEGVEYRFLPSAYDHLRVLKRKFKGLTGPRGRFLKSSAANSTSNSTRIPSTNSPKNKRPLVSSTLYYLDYALQVANDLRTQKCDIVHIHNFSQLVPVIRLLNPNIKIVLHMHCEWLTQLDRTMIAKRLHKVELILGCSEYITDKIRNTFPQYAGLCQTVYNGVDTDHFCNSNGTKIAGGNCKKRLLFVGRVSPEKGVHVLLEAFKNVIEKYPDAELEIVGPQGIPPLESIVGLSDETKIKELARFYSGSYHSYLQDGLCLGLSSQVSFIGSVPHLALPRYYSNADILINPSLYEAFGMTLVESMACQVPVIATRVGGMVEIVEDGKSGVLVEPDTSSALAEAILNLLSDEDLRKSMGIAARKRAVELFSYEKTVESLRQCYRRIC